MTEKVLHFIGSGSLVACGLLIREAVFTMAVLEVTCPKCYVLANGIELPEEAVVKIAKEDGTPVVRVFVDQVQPYVRVLVNGSEVYAYTRASRERDQEEGVS